jgi:hypothetical protein
MLLDLDSPSSYESSTSSDVSSCEFTSTLDDSLSQNLLSNYTLLWLWSSLECFFKVVNLLCDFYNSRFSDNSFNNSSSYSSYDSCSNDFLYRLAFLNSFAFIYSSSVSDNSLGEDSLFSWILLYLSLP